VVSARAQLDKAGMALPQRVILSHSHWDHAGGVLDFPQARVGVAAAELELVRKPSTGPGGTWASKLERPPSSGSPWCSSRRRTRATRKVWTFIRTARWCWSHAGAYAGLIGAFRHRGFREAVFLHR
jgi:ribonuclease BN (tRNA processing enzyme)